MPDARAAAHGPLKLSCTSVLLGTTSDHVSPSPRTRSLSPAGDQLNAWTAVVSNSWRGNPDSLTIHNPAGAPSAPFVAKATQCLSGRGEPVLNRIVWLRSS